MNNYQLSDIEYEDGCYSGIVTIFNKSNGNYEYFTFLYDMEIDNLNLKQRTFADFKAPFVNRDLSDYMLTNYWEITHEIKLELKMRKKGY